MKKYTQKIILKRAIIGIVSGWNVPILPDKVAKFDRNKYVRIFKVIGALSMFYIFSGLGLKFYPIFLYISIAFSLPYVTYRIVFVFFIILQYISNLKNGKYIVRNSPLGLDKFQTVLKFTAGTIKTISRSAVVTGLTVAYMSKLYDILS